LLPFGGNEVSSPFSVSFFSVLFLLYFLKKICLARYAHAPSNFQEENPKQNDSEKTNTE
jgi:hypothetical protein